MSCRARCWKKILSLISLTLLVSSRVPTPESKAPRNTKCDWRNELRTLHQKLIRANHVPAYMRPVSKPSSDSLPRRKSRESHALQTDPATRVGINSLILEIRRCELTLGVSDVDHSSEKLGGSKQVVVVFFAFDYSRI